MRSAGVGRALTRGFLVAAGCVVACSTAYSTAAIVPVGQVSVPPSPTPVAPRPPVPAVTPGVQLPTRAFSAPLTPQPTYSVRVPAARSGGSYPPPARPYTAPHLPPPVVPQQVVPQQVVPQQSQTVTVPLVVGSSLAVARSQLLAARLLVGTVSVRRTNVLSGTVLLTSPPPGAQVPIGTSVNLVVAG
ncbi:MAG TPA: PASTA domain-containing protein [Pseudonocardia sp.]